MSATYETSSNAEDSFYIIYLFLYGLQVCLDYWNSLVLELFEARHTMDGPAGTVSLMGLQVCRFSCL